MNLKDVLTNWFKRNLKPGQCYGSKRKAFTDKPPGTILIYQDGTGCSASCAFSDVFKVKDKEEYIVRTDLGICQEMGSNPDHEIVETKCNNIFEIYAELLTYSFHDSNTCGDLAGEIMNYVVKKKNSYLTE